MGEDLPKKVAILFRHLNEVALEGIPYRVGILDSGKRRAVNVQLTRDSVQRLLEKQNLLQEISGFQEISLTRNSDQGNRSLKEELRLKRREQDDYNN